MENLTRRHGPSPLYLRPSQSRDELAASFSLSNTIELLQWLQLVPSFRLWAWMGTPPARYVVSPRQNYVGEFVVSAAHAFPSKLGPFRPAIDLDISDEYPCRGGAHGIRPNSRDSSIEFQTHPPPRTRTRSSRSRRCSPRRSVLTSCRRCIPTWLRTTGRLTPSTQRPVTRLRPSLGEPDVP